MMTPTEYRIQCDNNILCAAHDRFVGVGARQVIKARSVAEARKKAKAAGWVRRHGRDRRLIDLCPDCAQESPCPAAG